jgi:hypothetical protein
MGQETNEGSGARGAGTRSGRVFFDEKAGVIKFYDENNRLIRIDGDVRDRAIADGQFGTVYVDINGDDKVFIGPKSAGIIETYFLGKLQIDITGGVLDGGTYSIYILTVVLHHGFSKRFPDFQVLYDWFGQNLNTFDGLTYQTITKNKVFPQLETSGGVASQSTPALSVDRKNGELHYLEGVVDANDPSNPNTEYQQWMWMVSWSSGTVTIPPQTLWLITQLYYLNETLPVITSQATYPQGGGGGILTEELHFYL